MLYYNIIDVFESIDANETSASKEYIIIIGTFQTRVYVSTKYL